MGIPRPLTPKSPNPRMRLPSVTTIASTWLAGQFHAIAAYMRTGTAGFGMSGVLWSHDSCMIRSLSL